MSGTFTVDWLALREPADHAARDRGLAAALAEALAGRPEPVRIVDLGCGTGSNLRALAPLLPERQSWRLVDNDAALLDRARETIAGWADETERLAGGDLRLRRAGRRLDVSFETRDLGIDLEAALGPAPDLVTAAALFDLLSPAAIAALARAVAARGALFHACLSVDGELVWRPAHAADVAIRAAFAHDMRRDKGLGPAAGQEAGAELAAAFAACGYDVRTGSSPWRLGAADAELRRALAEGIAEAVAGTAPPTDISSWLALRCEPEGEAIVGHDDVLALPPG